MVRKTPKVDRTVPTRSLVMVRKTFKRCSRSHHTVNSQQHTLSGGTITAYNLRRRSDHTVNAQDRAQSGSLVTAESKLKLCSRSDHTVDPQQHVLSGGCIVTAYNLRRRSNHTVNAQQHELSGSKRDHTVDPQQHAQSGGCRITPYNLRRRSNNTVNAQQHELSGSKWDHTVDPQQEALSGGCIVTAYNLRHRSNHTVNTQQHELSGSLVTAGNKIKRCCRSDHTVGPQQQALSGGRTITAYNLHCRSNHNVNSQQHALSGTLPITPELHRISVKDQGQTLPGSILMLGKTPELQVELPLYLVVDEILTRLPVKTLSRFRCVSKTLYSFISLPHFQKVHARRSQQTPLLLLATADTTGVHISTHTIHGEQLLKDFFINFPVPRTLNPYRFHLVQSCLGLVCLRINYNGALLIFNPSTAEVMTLPERPDQLFDLCVGFGYTDSSEEFKVVRFFTYYLFGDFTPAMEDDVHNEVCISEVFTLGSSDGWRKTRSNPPFKPFLTGHLPLVHGALHYLPSLHYHGDMRDDHYISAFDLSTEQYRGIPLPEIYFGLESTDGIFPCQLAELRGSLCMNFDFFHFKKFMQLWFLKDYHGGKWVKEYNIKLSYQPELHYAFSFTGDSHALLCTQFSKEEHKLCYYNAQKRCSTKKLRKDSAAMFYVDSFLPLPLGNRMALERSRSAKEEAAM